LDDLESPLRHRDRRGFDSFLLSAERAESKNIHPCGVKELLTEFQYNVTIIKFGMFSFAVPSTAKETIFNSATFASQAKRPVKQYEKYVIELAN
jgi:hypothetical protein